MPPCTKPICISPAPKLTVSPRIWEYTSAQASLVETFFNAYKALLDALATDSATSSQVEPNSGETPSQSLSGFTWPPS